MMDTKINRLIKESGLKKEYIAFKVEVSIYTLRNWRLGASYPNINQANKLKEVLKLDSILKVNQNSRGSGHENSRPQDKKINLYHPLCL